MLNFLTPPKPKPIDTNQARVESKYSRYRLEVFIGIFIGYAGYYLVRKNLTLAMPYLLDGSHPGFTKTALGVALSANAIAYGFSKFFMGSVSDRSNSRVFLPLGLVLASLVTLFMATGVAQSSIPLIFAIQFAIGWFQGMGWPPCGRVMTHWFSMKERGTKMSVWNVAHNIGGAAIGPLAIFGTAMFTSILATNKPFWQGGVFILPAIIALVIAFIAFLLIRDTPQSCGLPPIEEFKNDYSKNYSQNSERELTSKEIFFKYVLNNKTLWFIAIANAFVYLVRYGALDWAPTYLHQVKGYDLKEIGWAYFAYEFAAIPGTIICGWVSDKLFSGRRALTTIIYMVLVLICVLFYWLNRLGPAWDGVALILIGFLIYGPVMLIGVQALDLAPKKAAGTSAGLTGLFGYLFGTAILANMGMGYVVQHCGWTGGFLMLVGACVLSIFFIAFTVREEKYKAEQNKLFMAKNK